MITTYLNGHYLHANNPFWTVCAVDTTTTSLEITYYKVIITNKKINKLEIFLEKNRAQRWSSVALIKEGYSARDKTLPAFIQTNRYLFKLQSSPLTIHMLTNLTLK